MTAEAAANPRATADLRSILSIVFLLTLSCLLLPPNRAHYVQAADGNKGSDDPFPEEPHIVSPPAGPKHDHVVGFGSASLHAGRTDRHSAYRESSRVRLFRKEALESSRWHV